MESAPLPRTPIKRSSGLRFECTKCGDCCTNRGEYAHVYVNEEENEALAAFLGLSLRAFKRRYTFVDDDGWRQLSFRGKSCVFLDLATNLCQVHPARPTQCRTFPFWREFVVDGEWSEEVRSLCEGIGRGPLYSIEEAEDHIFEMDQSDQD